MSSPMQSKIDTVYSEVMTAMSNLDDAVEEELGHVKAILCAIELMAETDSHRFKLEIVSLAKCAHWIAESLESNVGDFGGAAIKASSQFSSRNGHRDLEADHG
jgi:hypothetical protein